MPISITDEQVITLTQAAQRLPCSRPGKKVHKSTLVRWATRGCRGHRLEVVRVGATLCTSAEALQRFWIGSHPTWRRPAIQERNTHRRHTWMHRCESRACRRVAAMNTQMMLPASEPRHEASPSAVVGGRVAEVRGRRDG
jgi:hypothetical protein